MAHNLTITKFWTAEFFYVVEKPWHGLGTELPARATSRQAMKAAGLEWAVKTEPLYRKQHGRFAAIEEAVLTVRDDTDQILGVVTPDYQIIQTQQAFEFIDALVGESAAIFETAGSLREGRRVFACAKLPGDLVITEGDVLSKYLFFISGHDGKMSFLVKFTGTRVVCENTSNIAISEATPRQSTIRHTGEINFKLDEVRRVLGLQLRYFTLFGEKARALSAKKISEAIARTYFERVVPFPVGSDVTIAQVERTRKLHDTFAFLFHEGRGNQLRGAKQTAWAAFNAITEWADHVNVLTQKGEPKASGFENALFGSGERLKQDAWDKALALL